MDTTTHSGITERALDTHEQPGSIAKISGGLCLVGVVAVVCLVSGMSLVDLREFFRPRIVRWVKQGLPFVSYVQGFNTPILSAAVLVSCQTVSIDFYEKTLPFLYWVVNPWLATHLILLLGFCVYFGNFLKDLFCAPRPADVEGKDGTQPAIHLLASTADAHTYASSKEYGLPSSHTMNSLVFSGFVAHYLVTNKVASGGLAYGVVAAWVMWIGFARLYMGLHTSVDILAGLIAGLVLLISWVLYADLERIGSVYSQACIWGLLLWLHPKPLQHTPTYTWTVTFAGVCCGFALGLQGHVPLDGSPLSALPRSTWWPPYLVGAVLWRVILGTIVALGAQLGVKYASFRVLEQLFAWVPLDVRRTWQPPVHSLVDDKLARAGIPLNERGQPWDVSLGARFLSYTALAWAVATVPAAFRTVAAFASGQG